jgi:hypothetical protein
VGICGKNGGNDRQLKMGRTPERIKEWQKKIRGKDTLSLHLGTFAVESGIQGWKQNGQRQNHNLYRSISVVQSLIFPFLYARPSSPLGNLTLNFKFFYTPLPWKTYHIKNSDPRRLTLHLDLGEDKRSIFFCFLMLKKKAITSVLVYWR